MPLDFTIRAIWMRFTPSDIMLELSLLCRSFLCCSSFLSSFCSGSLFSSLSCSLFSLSFLLSKSFCPSLVYFNFSLYCCFGFVSGNLVKTRFLSLDLSIPLSFPVSKFLVSLLLCKSSLSDTAVKVILKEDTLIREDTTSHQCQLCTNLKPSQCSLAVENDSSRVCVRIVRADLLDETTIARCASVSHNNVEECEILLSVAL